MFPPATARWTTRCSSRCRRAASFPPPTRAPCARSGWPTPVPTPRRAAARRASRRAAASAAPSRTRPARRRRPALRRAVRRDGRARGAGLRPARSRRALPDRDAGCPAAACGTGARPDPAAPRAGWRCASPGTALPRTPPSARGPGAAPPRSRASGAGPPGGRTARRRPWPRCASGDARRPRAPPDVARRAAPFPRPRRRHTSLRRCGAARNRWRRRGPPPPRADRGRSSRVPPLAEEAVDEAEEDEQRAREHRGPDGEGRLARTHERGAELVAERVVVDEVGPVGRRPPDGHVREVEAARPRLDPEERGAHAVGHVVLHGLERLRGLDLEARQRILAAEADEVDPFAEVGHEGQVVAPGAVDVRERHDDLGPTHGVRAGRADERFVAFALVAPDVRLLLAPEERLPSPVNEPPVVLHRLRVSPQRPADLPVLALDDALGTRDLAPDDGAVDGGLLVLRPRARRDQPLHPVAREQVVLEAPEETRGAGIALAPGPAAKLQVDAPGLVAIGADDVQAAERYHRLPSALVLSAQADVRASPRHVGGDRHRPGRARARHDARLPLVVARVEDLALHAVRAQPRGQALGFGDGERAHQDRAAGGVRPPHLVHDRG